MMTDSFNRIYGEPDDPFYYGLAPTKELEAFLKDHPQRGQALDLGCGEGRNSLLLARYGFYVHAIDVSSHGIHKLERYIQSHGLHNIDCTVADVRELQLGPNSYNAIVAVTLLDHMSKEEGKKVSESIIAALKPGGFVYIEVFTIHDPGGAKSVRSEATDTVSETASFVKHYFEEGELATWFSQLKTFLYEEIMKYDDAHGTPHYHGIARLIGRNP